MVNRPLNGRDSDHCMLDPVGRVRTEPRRMTEAAATRFRDLPLELTVNMTAEALGITVLAALLASAAEVIE